MSTITAPTRTATLPTTACPICAAAEREDDADVRLGRRIMELVARYPDHEADPTDLAGLADAMLRALVTRGQQWRNPARSVRAICRANHAPAPLNAV